MFEIFAETLDGMPPPAALNFLKRIHQNIEDALLYKRLDDTLEVNSVLSFCQFMNLVMEEEMIFPIDGLPTRHVAFYGKTVLRLIEAGEIPRTAKKKFDAAFSATFLRNLAAC